MTDDFNPGAVADRLGYAAQAYKERGEDARAASAWTEAARARSAFNDEEARSIEEAFREKNADYSQILRILKDQGRLRAMRFTARDVLEKLGKNPVVGVVAMVFFAGLMLLLVIPSIIQKVNEQAISAGKETELARAVVTKAMKDVDELRAALAALEVERDKLADYVKAVQAASEKMPKQKLTDVVESASYIFEQEALLRERSAEKRFKTIEDTLVSDVAKHVSAAERLAVIEKAMGGDPSYFRSRLFDLLMYCQSVGRVSAQVIRDPNLKEERAHLEAEAVRLSKAWWAFEEVFKSK